MNFYRNMNLPVQKLDQRSVIGVGSDKMAALASHGRTWNLVFSHARTCWQHFDLEWFDIPDAWAQHCSSCFRWCLETFWSVTFAQASLKVSSSSWRFPHHCLQNGAHEGHEGDEGNEGNEGNESHEEHEVDEEGRWRGDASNEGHEGNEGNEGDEVICSLMMAMLASFGSFDAPKWHSRTNTGRSSFRSVGPELSCTAPREWTQGSCHARQQKDFGWVSLKVRAFLFEVPLVEDDSRLWWWKYLPATPVPCRFAMMAGLQCTQGQWQRQGWWTRSWLKEASLWWSAAWEGVVAGWDVDAVRQHLQCN